MMTFERQDFILDSVKRLIPCAGIEATQGLLIKKLVGTLRQTKQYIPKWHMIVLTDPFQPFFL